MSLHLLEAPAQLLAALDMGLARLRLSLFAVYSTILYIYYTILTIILYYTMLSRQLVARSYGRTRTGSEPLLLKTQLLKQENSGYMGFSKRAFM